MKDVIILGASGSIGRQTIDIILNTKNEFRIVGMSLGRDLKLAQELVDLVKPEIITLREGDINFNGLKYYGDEGLLKLASYKTKNDMILVNALVGSSGLLPTIYAIKSKKDIALANKETLVMAGDIINSLVKEYKVNLLPIDSEHSAILECLKGEKIEDVKDLIITASGGSFRDKKREELKDVTVNEALAHPNWQMGPKITIDSATMMNKGFEVIEAHHLFNVPYDKIKTILHKESIVHSLVMFNDGAIKAELAVSDMRIPIMYALSYPKHVLNKIEPLNLVGLNLHFEELSYKRYPLLELAYKMGKKGSIYTTVLNAANEAAVNLFLNNKIKFLEIEDIIFTYTNKNYDEYELDIDNILYLDKMIKTDIFKKYGDK